MDLIRRALALAQDPKNNGWISCLLIAFDIVLSLAIVRTIAYTEIDWRAYMQQVSLYLSGELDYTKLVGDTGPLVYPAAHVYIYRLLYHITGEGADIRLAQYIFVGLYIATLALVLSCYRTAGVPPWVMPLLTLSKRLHSIFLLRLFNDGFAAFFLFAAILCYQRKWWTVGSLAFSLGLGVKMSLLLALPAVGVVLWLGAGRDRALKQAALMGQVQVVLGYEFLGTNARSYLSKAFEFSRQFMFKWTVNWRFVGEDAFLSRPFSIALLTAHAVLLLAFLQTQWLRPAGISIFGVHRLLLSPPSQQEHDRITRRVTPNFVLTTILTAMMVGCLCARSLHYQFYAYIAWSTPFLLWQAGLHPVLVYAIWAAQEVAWNVYPSTNVSSMVVVGCLATAVASGWQASKKVNAASKQDGKAKHAHVE
ncbi:hypothetical protein Q7P37_006802 [Cladosporium fusiforme]